jgi:hypothetical protein
MALGGMHNTLFRQLGPNPAEISLQTTIRPPVQMASKAYKAYTAAPNSDCDTPTVISRRLNNPTFAFSFLLQLVQVLIEQIANRVRRLEL